MTIPFVLCVLMSTVLAAQNTFTLYAYGTNISGSQVFYSQGIAQIGDVRYANSSNVSNVYFYEESGKFIANPNITSTTASLKASESNTTWTDLSFYIPKSSGQPLGFTTNINSAEVTTGSWHFYGEYAFIENSAGQLESHFFAQPTDVDGVYNILWSLSDQAQLASPEIKSISIRTIPPASG
ncbi:uncharacterized protein TRUGW13939_00275 [Talaromyces rugulosus]|uniref:Uncharacterized protein n=1 Tax=Talaromyces rugulosus TaxID=121627 RepID=A0A7H8QGY3_TALRU|nr:uncharacterized protein TRUGW13939_00275 [Talaromyces rugulosus]QKX53199.1 hypothetical protein TRUGW13939_00275 [Talaromyces rugulosus]